MEIASDNQIYLHIGFPKTGTTTLQAALTKLKGVESVGLRENFAYANADFEAFYKFLILTDEARFSFEEADYLYKKAFSGLNASGKIIISDENFAGVTHGFPDLIADRLLHFFPSAKVFISLRNQVDLLRSYYEMEPMTPLRNSADRRKKQSYNAWLEVAHAQKTESILPYLQFDRLIDAYQTLFGKEKVVVTLYEDWKKDSVSYYKTLEDFFDLEKNELSGNFEKLGKQNTSEDFYIQSILKEKIGKTSWIRFLPKPLKQILRSVLLKFKPIPTISTQNLQFLNEYYRSSNKQLETKLKLNLAQYGYPL